MPRCGCQSSGACNCIISAGVGTAVSGSGTDTDPYRIRSTGPSRDEFTSLSDDLILLAALVAFNPSRAEFDTLKAIVDELLGGSDSQYMDFTSYTDGQDITTDDPSGLVTSIVGDVRANEDAALEGLPMGATIYSVAGGSAFYIRADSPYRWTISVSYSSFTGFPSGGDRSLVKVSGTSWQVALTGAGVIRLQNQGGSAVDHSRRNLAAAQPFRLQVSCDFNSGKSDIEVHGFMGDNAYGSVPDFILASVITADTGVTPTGAVAIGSPQQTPNYAANLGYLQYAGSARAWQDPPISKNPAAIYHGGFIGYPTSSEVEVTAMLGNVPAVKLLVSASSSMTSPTVVASQPVSAWGVVRHTVPLAAPETPYWIQYQDADGINIGPVRGPIYTQPVAGYATAKTRNLLFSSCQTSGDALKGKTVDYDQPAWKKMLELIAAAPVHAHLQVGDFHYGGSTFSGTELVGAHIAKYRNQLTAFNLMRQVFDQTPALVQISDHETSNNGGNNWEFYTRDSSKWHPGLPDYGAITRTAIDAYQHLMPVKPAEFGDVRTPIMGRWFAFNLLPSIRVVSLDFRSLERNLQEDPDSASKHGFGAAQVAWLNTELRRSEVLKILVCDVPWGPANPAGGEQFNDKIWCYKTEMKQIADLIYDSAGDTPRLTAIGTPINVDFLGGDRHALGYLGKANNVLADGQKCKFPVLLSSGTDKMTLSKVTGELYDQWYGDASTLSEIRAFMHLAYTDTPSGGGHGTISRVANGWSGVANMAVLAPPPSVYAPFQPTGFVNITDTWTY